MNVLKVLRSQIIFIYDSVFCIPNGDPFTGEQRYDEATNKVLISDVRIKRYVRDFFNFLNLIREEKTEIYLQEVRKEDLESVVVGSGSEARLKQLELKYGKKTEDLVSDTPEEASEGKKGKKKAKVSQFDAKGLMKMCVDVRLFGGVSTAKGNNAQLTGPVQFESLNPSLNKIELRRHQNTSVFQSDMEKSQGAIGTTSLVPYSLNQIIGYVNPFLAMETDLTEKEVEQFLDVLWNAVNTCTSRSKTDQTSRLILKINMGDPCAKLADLRDKIKIKEDGFDLRSISEITWDFSGLVAVIASDKVASVQYRVEEAIAGTFKQQLSSVADKLISF
jgi:CRISPR-associated protein Csh2